MNYNYGRTMELPNLPWWSAATFVPPILPSAYTPSWGMGTFPATAPIVWAVPPFPFVPPAFGPLSYVPAPDEEIKNFVKRAIDNDPAIPAGVDISVVVQNGVVTLTGTVPNKRIKHAAGDDAWWVPGVDDVRNELEVGRRRPAREEVAASPPTRAAEGPRRMRR